MDETWEQEQHVLFVDDDANILSAYQRQLRKQYRIETRLGGEEGLDAIRTSKPFAVIIADMRMPGMDGVEFLRKAMRLSPDSVRMMLTGNADQQTAIDAVNEGHIFRFLTKPCAPEVLAKSLAAGIEQYRLITAEKQLLEETLTGCIAALTEALSTADPAAYGRAARLRRYARHITDVLVFPNSWQLEVASMLSQIGRMALPQTLVTRARNGHELTEEEEEQLERVPEIGRNLLLKIPRMERVAQIVFYQNKRFDGTGFPRHDLIGEEIPYGARVLKVLADLVELECEGATRTKAFELMRSREGWYDPQILDAARGLFETTGTLEAAA